MPLPWALYEEGAASNKRMMGFRVLGLGIRCLKVQGSRGLEFKGLWFFYWKRLFRRLQYVQANDRHVQRFGVFLFLTQSSRTGSPCEKRGQGNLIAV